MTLKDFLKAWKECAKTQEIQHKTTHETKAQNANLRRDKTKECECFLRENYGINQAELDDMIWEIQADETKKWWNNFLFEYFLDKIDSCNPNALKIKEKFKLDEFGFSELKKLLQDDEFVDILEEFWQNDMF